MAQVMNKTLYGSVSGTQAAEKQESKGAFGGIIWLVVLAVVGAGVFAFVSTGNGKAALEKWKGTFRELGGSVTGKKK